MIQENYSCNFISLWRKETTEYNELVSFSSAANQIKFATEITTIFISFTFQDYKRLCCKAERLTGIVRESSPTSILPIMINCY